VQKADALPLPGLSPASPIYIGSAVGRGGLAGRCHFDARTANHSPRKSLAVLLRQQLGLRAVLVPKPNSPDTWGLEDVSEAKLSNWMHHELAVAFTVCENPREKEAAMIRDNAPPLNLLGCAQTHLHVEIRMARRRVMDDLRNAGA
jgi:hypothetical protein